jgi:hypothetical protein
MSMSDWFNNIMPKKQALPKKDSNICRTENCNRPQLKDAGGYCHICYQRYKEKKAIDQNDQIINLLVKLNNNIENLDKKLSNPQHQTTTYVESNIPQQTSKKQTISKIKDETFIPDIDISGEVKSTDIKEMKITKNITDLANRLKSFDNL